MLLCILRNLVLMVASVLLQVLSRDVIRGVNGSFKQRHFPGAGFCHPVSGLSRDRFIVVMEGCGGSATACNHCTISTKRARSCDLEGRVAALVGSSASVSIIRTELQKN